MTDTALVDLINARVAGLPCTPEAAALADALIAALQPLVATLVELIDPLAQYLADTR